MVADADATHHEYDSRDVNSRIWLLASLFARVGATPPQTLSDYFTTRNSVRSIRLAPSLSLSFPLSSFHMRESREERDRDRERKRERRIVAHFVLVLYDTVSLYIK